MQAFVELKVWQRSHALVLQICRLSATSPVDERFGIAGQLRRAAVSVPTNIAEGSKRRSNPESARFLNVAEGSLVETEYLLILARDLELGTGESIDPLLREVGEIALMLNALRQKVERG